MRRRRRPAAIFRAAALLLALLGVASLGEAARLEAKAWLGQVLIARAWQRMQRGEEAPRPWPWADTWPVARLQVPAHGVDLVVLEGATGRTLAWGPGHLAGTAPVGAPGNSVVVGHRDTHFAFLEDLELGNEIRIEDVRGHWHVYHVAGSFVTGYRDSLPAAASPEARLTLVTCWPFHAALPGGTLRYVVVAEGGGRGRAAARAELRRPPGRATPPAWRRDGGGAPGCRRGGWSASPASAGWPARWPRRASSTARAACCAEGGRRPCAARSRPRAHGASPGGWRAFAAPP